MQLSRDKQSHRTWCNVIKEPIKEPMLYLYMAYTLLINSKGDSDIDKLTAALIIKVIFPQGHLCCPPRCLMMFVTL